MKMAFKAKYDGTCKRCGDSIDVGQRIEGYSGGRGYQHVGCTADGEPETNHRHFTAEQRRMDAEYAAGQADYERWKFNRQMFGDEYAAAEELAWDMKLGNW
jgi:hypothetical protein